MDELVYVSDPKTDVILFANARLHQLFGQVEGQCFWQVLRFEQNARCSICPTALALVNEQGEPNPMRRWREPIRG